MTLAHLYQNFGGKAGGADGSGDAVDEALEEEKLKSFESGYQAGWDDAIKAQEDTRTHVSAEFARNLQEISFSYHEARAALKKDLGAFLAPVLQNLLPSVGRDGLSQHVLEHVTRLAQEHMERPVEIAVAPEKVETLTRAFDAEFEEPFKIVGDNGLSEDDVFVRLGTAEVMIDIEPWLQEIRDHVTAYLTAPEKEQSDG